MKYGKETAQAVLDKIRMHPELHDQNFFDMDKHCGTSHCVAGWAIDIHKKLNPNVLLDCDHNDSLGYSGSIGAKLLCLNEEDADILFYRTNNQQALHAMEYLAKGDRIDWEAVQPR